MARYGIDPLPLTCGTTSRGVYDAQAQTLDVYVNGKIDNGFLLGTRDRLTASVRERPCTSAGERIEAASNSPAPSTMCGCTRAR